MSDDIKFFSYGYGADEVKTILSGVMRRSDKGIVHTPEIGETVEESLAAIEETPVIETPKFDSSEVNMKTFGWGYRSHLYAGEKEPTANDVVAFINGDSLERAHKIPTSAPISAMILKHICRAGGKITADDLCAAMVNDGYNAAKPLSQICKAISKLNARMRDTTNGRCTLIARPYNQNRRFFLPSVFVTGCIQSGHDPFNW